MFWIKDGIGEPFGVDKATLKQMVEATVREHERKNAKPKPRADGANSASRSNGMMHGEKRNESAGSKNVSRSEPTKKLRIRNEKKRRIRGADQTAKSRT